MARTDNLMLPGGIYLDLADEPASGEELMYRNVGNIVSPELEQVLETLQHYTSQGGTRAKDKEVIVERGFNFNFEFDEVNIENLRHCLMASSATANTAGAVAIAGERVVLNGTTPAQLRFPGASTPVITSVKSLDGTTHTVTTDYTAATSNGVTTITRVDGGGITDGEAVSVTYEWDAPAHYELSPHTNTIFAVRARITVLPDNGPSFTWAIEKGEYRSNGNLALGDEDWLRAPMSLAILDNSAADAANPFGVFRQWGGDSTAT